MTATLCLARPSLADDYDREMVRDAGNEKISDPRRLRALAHPVRLRILESLRSDGAATVSLLATRLAIAPASLSYHLRQLGAHEFIEIDPTLARDGREKWWKARPAGVSWSSADFLDTEDRRLSAGALRRAVVGRHTQLIDEFIGELDAAAWSEDWTDAAVILDDILDLTPSELRQVQREIMKLLERRRATGEKHRKSSESVILLLYAFPRQSTL